MPSRLLLLGLAACAAALPACSSDGHFTVLGYSTKPNYDPNIRTVRVPIFKNKTPYVVTPVVGMEMDLTRAVIREIEAKTPFKVVQDCEAADTELRGTIVGLQKSIINYNPFNEVREAEYTLFVQLIWRDLRTGKLLSRPQRRPGQAADDDPPQPLLATPNSIFPPGVKPVPIASVPTAPQVVAGQGEYVEGEDFYLDPRTRKPIMPVSVQATGRAVPEVGQSTSTAYQDIYNRMAVQIISLMETGW